MPYIAQGIRASLDDGRAATSAGELNYLITKLIHKYIETNGLKYAKINDVVGALEGAKLEFYRRIAVPYEEEKIKTNGDI